MSYLIKELFYTLQGEGANTGRPAVFCRFTGCNLWSGRETNRSDAICQFCDTDFVGTDGTGGSKYATPAELADAAIEQWPCSGGSPLVVCTGGEPLLQLGDDLVDAFHERGFQVAIETNGTLSAPRSVDWVCVSPKASAEWKLRTGDELKLVFPQLGAEPDKFESWDFTHFFLQPMDGPGRLTNTESAVQYCLEHPRWRLSLQTHKYLGIP